MNFNLKNFVVGILVRPKPPRLITAVYKFIPKKFVCQNISNISPGLKRDIDGRKPQPNISNPPTVLNVPTTPTVLKAAKSTI